MSIGSIAGSSNQTTAAERASELLGRMDTDQDGLVSQSEFSVFDEMMKAQGGNGPPPPPPELSASSDGTSVQEPPDAETMFSTADTNADGSLSLDELSSMLAELETHSMGAEGPPPPTDGFSTADTNADGSLDLDELTAMFNNEASTTSSVQNNGSITVEQLEALLSQLKSTTATSTT